MLKLFKFILPFFLLFACTDGGDPIIVDVPQIPVVLTPVDTLTYLALGDSYTIGTSVGIEDRFPHQLANRLSEDSIVIKAPRYIAKVGWTTGRLSDAIAEEDVQESYDLVSLLIGVNNQFQGKSFENYEGEFTLLLKTAIYFAEGKTDRVIVVSIPDYAYTPFGQSRPNPELISEEINTYNAVNKKVADSLGVAYFDITPISREGLTDEELIAVDGLHPSGKMYGEWIDLMFDNVKELLVN